MPEVGLPVAVAGDVDVSLSAELDVDQVQPDVDAALSAELDVDQMQPDVDAALSAELDVEQTQPDVDAALSAELEVEQTPADVDTALSAELDVEQTPTEGQLGVDLTLSEELRANVDTSQVETDLSSEIRANADLQEDSPDAIAIDTDASNLGSLELGRDADISVEGPGLTLESSANVESESTFSEEAVIPQMVAQECSSVQPPDEDRPASIPFTAHLPESLRCGRKIVVNGRINPDTKQSTISLKNFNCPEDRMEEFQVLIAVEPDDSTLLVCKQFTGRHWTAEERAITDSFHPHREGNFHLEIQTSSAGFQVSLEDVKCVHPHRVPFSNFTHMILDGDSEYQNVEFPEELELPYSEEFPQSVELISSIRVKLQTSRSPPTSKVTFGFDRGATMLCNLDLLKQTVSVGRLSPETGGFLCETKVDKVPQLQGLAGIELKFKQTSVLVQLDGKPVVSYELPHPKQFVTNFFIEGNFLLKDVATQEKRANKATPLAPDFQVGRRVRVSGVVPPESSGFKVALAAGKEANADQGFQFSCQPSSPMQLGARVNSKQVGQLPLSRPPLAAGQHFDIVVAYKVNGFELALGETEAGATLQHQLDPRRLTHVLLSGDAIFYEVDMPQRLALPYFNKFPVSLKESRFVTASIEPSDSQGPMTISFALCCGPGDSSLKPLVCEVNMTQGYATLGWTDAEGRVCDEETIRFDPKATKDAETVSLQATDSEYIISINDAAALKYKVRHNLEDIHFVMLDGLAIVNDVRFEGQEATSSVAKFFAGLFSR